MLSLGSWAEVLIIVIAALILVGPKELPQVLRTCGRLIFKLRQFSHQVQDGFNELINEGQIEEYSDIARKQAHSHQVSEILDLPSETVTTNSKQPDKID